ncbi:MAG TPA: type VII secretion protein EccE [Pseudonocardiaceae bacterium]|nr:type VII secretion protein EccE [Pseudonocardiaceae bacterium]
MTVGVLRLCGWQLALIAIVLGIGRPWPLAALLWAGALLLLALTAVRVRGRWLGEWLSLALRYSARDRQVDLGSAGPPGPALLRRLDPDATGSTVRVGDEPIHLISRASGITAILRPAVGDPAAVLGAPETLLPAADPTIAVQVLHHAGIDRRQPPRTWLALQVLRTAETYQDAELQRTLGNAVRRVRKHLRRLGCPAGALAEHEVFGTLAALAHVTGGRGQIRESWRHWQSGPIGQATFRLDGWSEAARSGTRQLTGWLLAAAPHTAVTISITAHRAAPDPEPRVRATLRLAAANPQALAQSEGQLTEAARHCAITLTRLDGRHAEGMAATLPIGLS